LKRFQVVMPDELFNELSAEAAALSKKKGKTVSIAAVLRAHALCDQAAIKKSVRAKKNFLDTLERQG